MGWMTNHAIVVSSWNTALLVEAHAKAVEVFGKSSPPSNIVPSMTNGITSFFVPPDGSKEGWLESDMGNGRRDEFVKWLRTKTYDDGSTSLKWVEVQYADDGNVTRVVRDSDHRDNGEEE